jgi:hypothetical protein
MSSSEAREGVEPPKKKIKERGISSDEKGPPNPNILGFFNQWEMEDRCSPSDHEQRVVLAKRQCQTTFSNELPNHKPDILLQFFHDCCNICLMTHPATSH